MDYDPFLDFASDFGISEGDGNGEFNADFLDLLESDTGPSDSLEIPTPLRARDLLAELSRTSRMPFRPGLAPEPTFDGLNAQEFERQFADFMRRQEEKLSAKIDSTSREGVLAQLLEGDASGEAAQELMRFGQGIQEIDVRPWAIDEGLKRLLVRLRKQNRSFALLPSDQKQLVTGGILAEISNDPTAREYREAKAEFIEAREDSDFHQIVADLLGSAHGFIASKLDAIPNIVNAAGRFISGANVELLPTTEQWAYWLDPQAAKFNKTMDPREQAYYDTGAIIGALGVTGKIIKPAYEGLARIFGLPRLEALSGIAPRIGEALASMGLKGLTTAAIDAAATQKPEVGLLTGGIAAGIPMAKALGRLFKQSMALGFTGAAELTAALEQAGILPARNILPTAIRLPGGNMVVGGGEMTRVLSALGDMWRGWNRDIISPEVIPPMMAAKAEELIKGLTNQKQFRKLLAGYGVKFPRGQALPPIEQMRTLALEKLAPRLTAEKMLEGFSKEQLNDLAKRWNVSIARLTEGFLRKKLTDAALAETKAEALARSKLAIQARTPTKYKELADIYNTSMFLDNLNRGLLRIKGEGGHIEREVERMLDELPKPLSTQLRHEMLLASNARGLVRGKSPSEGFKLLMAKHTRTGREFLARLKGAAGRPFRSAKWLGELLDRFNEDANIFFATRMEGSKGARAILNQTIGQDTNKGLDLIKLLEGRFTGQVDKTLDKAAGTVKAIFDEVAGLAEQMKLRARTTELIAKDKTGGGVDLIRQAKFYDWMPRENYATARFSEEVMADVHAGGERMLRRVRQLFNEALDKKGNPIFDAPEEAEAFFNNLRAHPYFETAYMDMNRIGSPYGRIFDAIPDSMRERNIPRLLENYLGVMARLISMQRNFGRNNAMLDKLRRGIENNLPADSAGATLAFIDDYIIDPLLAPPRMSPGEEKALRYYATAMFAGKIATNPRVIAIQLPQPLLGATKESGLRRVAEGYARTLKAYIDDWSGSSSEALDLLRTAGIGFRSSAHLVSDMMYQDLKGKLKAAIGTIGLPFVKMDELARQVSATTAITHAEDLIRWLRGERSIVGLFRGRIPFSDSAANRELTIRWLEKMGVRKVSAALARGFLTPDEKRQVAARASRVTNFAATVLDLPAWMRATPLMRFLTMFQSFGVQQSKLTIDAFADAIRRKANIGQLASLFTGSQLSGEGMLAFQNALRGSQRQEDLSGWEGRVARIWNNMIASGVLGLLGAIITDESGMAIQPVFINDLRRMWNASRSLGRRNKDLGTAITDMIHGFLPVSRMITGSTFDARRRDYEQVFTGINNQLGTQRTKGAGLVGAVSRIRSQISRSYLGQAAWTRQAYLDRNEDRLKNELDDLLQNNNNDLEALERSFRTSLDKSNPADLFFQMDFNRAINWVKQFDPDGSRMMNAVAFYQDMVRWNYEVYKRWRQERGLPDIPWKSEKSLMALLAENGPDFYETRFFKTMPEGIQKSNLRLEIRRLIDPIYRGGRLTGEMVDLFDEPQRLSEKLGVDLVPMAQPGSRSRARRRRSITRRL